MGEFRKKYGPWALITGASSGIGAEFARQLAQKGLNLVLVARRKDRLEELAEQLERANGISVKTVPVDLTNPGFIVPIRHVTDPLEIGLLVNNAGAASEGRFLDNAVEDALQVLHINCQAPLILTHEFGRKMTQRKRGGLIFLASMLAYQGVPFMADYASTKGFNLLFAEALWWELQKDHVDVLALSPGFTQTELVKDLNFSTIPISPMPVQPVVTAALRALGHQPAVIPGLINKILNLSGKYLTSRSFNTAVYARLVSKVLQA